jgi:hypothetical protein
MPSVCLTGDGVYVEANGSVHRESPSDDRLVRLS